MVNEKIKKKTVMMFGGAIIAFLIGSGFATGQEILQYFAGYGYLRPLQKKVFCFTN